MKIFAIQGSCDPYIVTLTRNVIKNVEERNKFAQADAILKWTKENIKYLDDVKNVDTVATPILTAKEYKQGDCDDISTLLASMLLSINIPTRFAIIKVFGKEFEHVYVEAQLNGRWRAIDPVNRSSYIGWEYPGRDKKTIPIDVYDKELAQAFAMDWTLWMRVYNNATKALQNIYKAYRRGEVTDEDINRAAEALNRVIPHEGEGIGSDTIKRIPAYANTVYYSMKIVDFVKNPMVITGFVGAAGLYLLWRLKRGR